MAFKKQLLIHFDQADPAGILFYGQIFTMAHRTMEEMISQTSVGWNEWFNTTDKIGAPVRHTEANYLIPLLAGHKYWAEVNVEKISESSIHFQINFYSDKGTHAVVKTTHTFVDFNSMPPSKVPIPSDIKKKFLEL